MTTGDRAAALRMRHGTSKSPWRPRTRGAIVPPHHFFSASLAYAPGL